MPKLKDYPKGFSNIFPPSSYLNPPEKVLVSFKTVDTVELHTDDLITEQHLGYKIDCIYEDDYAGNYIRLRKEEKIEKENPNYNKALTEYNKLLAEHEKRVEKWKVLKEKWDKEEKEEIEKQEKIMFLRLKKKFEKE